jgi:phage portal protein BeeE
VALFRRKDASRSNLPDPETVAALSLTQTWGDQTNERIQQTFQSFSIFGFGSNAVVYACELQRIQLLSQAEFKFQDKRTRRLFGNPDLAILEEPWPNGTTADLIARMELHAGLAGNAFVRRAKDSLVVMRPDWTDIVSVELVTGTDPNGVPQVHREVIGYLYSEGGIGVGDAVFYDVDEVAHWAPIPDPLSRWRGMSWLTPVLREINADVAMTTHRQVFFDSAATPNLILKYKQKLGEPQIEKIKRAWKGKFSGPVAAGSTVVLDEGADLTVVGSTFEAMTFGDLQAAGEARIAAASGVPAIVAGLQAGLDAATYSNFQVAMKAFAATTGAFLWSSLCSSLARLVVVPDGTRLRYDTTAIPALQEAEKDRADTMAVLATAANTLLTAGFEATSIIAALVSGDLTQLDHTGMISVQLIPNDMAALKAKEAGDTVLAKDGEPPEPAAAPTTSATPEGEPA